MHACAHLRLGAFKRVLEVRGNESDRGISKCATWPLNGALLKRRSPLEQVEKAVQPACLKRHFILKLQSCGGLELKQSWRLQEEISLLSERASEQQDLKTVKSIFLVP